MDIGTMIERKPQAITIQVEEGIPVDDFAHMVELPQINADPAHYLRKKALYMRRKLELVPSITRQSWSETALRWSGGRGGIRNGDVATLMRAEGQRRWLCGEVNSFTRS